MSIRIWYSGATDVTGKALAEALAGKRIDTSHGPAFQSSKPDLLVCYGCKHGDGWNPSRISGWNVLNDPTNIRRNANKFLSLIAMKDADIAVALPIVETSAIDSKLGAGEIAFPIVGRTKFHQGGKGFWLCLQKADVVSAVSEGAHYFQPYIPKSEEYRIHVFGGEHLFTAKKVRRPDPYDDWRKDRKDAIIEKARERRIDIDTATIDLTLEYAPKRIKLPDTAIRSVHRGWVFKDVPRPKASLIDLARKTARTMGLDFAAVDIMVGDDRVDYVLEANTGPGLRGQNIGKYVAAIEKKHLEIIREKSTNSSSRRAIPGPNRTSRPTTSRRNRDAVKADREVSVDEGLSTSVKGLLKGVDVNNLNNAEKQAVKAVLGNIINEELGL